MSVRHSNENLVSLGDDDAVTCTLCNGVIVDLDLTETAFNIIFTRLVYKTVCRTTTLVRLVLNHVLSPRWDLIRILV